MTTDRDTVQRANTLYWNSSASVNDLAEELDLAKGTLYSLLEPQPAGMDCPDCGQALEYANRTARDKGLVTCSGCGMEEEETLVRADLGEEIAGAAHEAIGFPARTVVAAGLLGAAAGLALGRLIMTDRRG